jgi:hypothetical protein
MAKRIAIGLVARCKRGITGLILSISKVRDRPLYKGVCLDRGRVGQTWQSFNPELIGTLDDWVRLRSEELYDEAHEAMYRSMNKPVTPRSLK